MKKRILSILLLCCMVLTLLPATAFAVDGESAALPPDTGSLCECHPEHDEVCGYTEGTEDAPGTPCGHVCEIRESGDGRSIRRYSTKGFEQYSQSCCHTIHLCAALRRIWRSQCASGSGCVQLREKCMDSRIKYDSGS